MGQAKQRGTRDHRIEHALGFKEMPLSELRKLYGLREDAVFLGYAIHIEKSDEFLAVFEITEEMTKRAWAKTPELALRFESVTEAHDASKACKGSIIVGMWDTGEQIFVVRLTGLRSVK
jgi:hypothetical protein